MKTWTFFLGAFSLFAAGSAFARDFQKSEDIRQTVEERTLDYLTAIYGEQRVKSDIEFRVSNLDSRLKLPACELPIHAMPKENGFGGKNLSVKVQCTSASPWTIYVPVVIDIYSEVAITTRNISRGEVLAASDFSMKRTNTSVVGHNFIDEASQVDGKVAKRPLRAGRVILSQDLKKALLVNKGETIMLVANTGALQVSSEGVALSNGTLGEQIRVKNARSQRIVDARIVAPGRAEVW